MFLDIVIHHKEPFSGKQWDISEKGDVRTIKLKENGREGCQGEECFERVEYLLDKKNYYMKNEYQDTIREVGLYFRNDKTPIVASGYTLDRASGPYHVDTSIRFYEYRCPGPGKNGSCRLKEVTNEVFPAITISDFLDDSPTANRILKEAREKYEFSSRQMFYIKYKIPRIGTTILAVLYTDRNMSGLLGSVLKKTCIDVKWNKSKEKFEAGKGFRDMKYVEYYYQN